MTVMIPQKKAPIFHLSAHSTYHPGSGTSLTLPRRRKQSKTKQNKTNKIVEDAARESSSPERFECEIPATPHLHAGRYNFNIPGRLASVAVAAMSVLLMVVPSSMGFGARRRGPGSQLMAWLRFGVDRIALSLAILRKWG